MGPTRILLPAAGAALALVLSLSYLLCPSPPATGPATAEQRCVFGPDPQVGPAQQRAEAKREVAEAVRTGRLTVVQGAGRFRTIDETAPPAVRLGLRLTYKGDSDEERYRRAVIQYVSLSHPGSPAEAEATRLRLEADLQIP